MQQMGMMLMFIFSATIAGALLLLTSLLGPKRPTAEKAKPFECGNDPRELPSGRITIRFYLVGLLFILFDVELAFLFPWAIVLRQLGSFAFLGMAIYLFVVFTGLIYAIKKGALEWE